MSMADNLALWRGLCERRQFQYAAALIAGNYSNGLPWDGYWSNKGVR